VTTVTLVDTGPLVAFCDQRDKHHDWTVATLGSISGPLTTCEAVLTEACFLLKQQFDGAEEIFELLNRGLLQIRFDLAVEHERVGQLLKRYGDLPTSLADACLVRMAEVFPTSRVMTIDRDFLVYRRHGRQVIPLLAPFA
jgi:predicted nucleic acid-binding protein